MPNYEQMVELKKRFPNYIKITPSFTGARSRDNPKVNNNATANALTVPDKKKTFMSNLRGKESKPVMPKEFKSVAFKKLDSG